MIPGRITSDAECARKPRASGDDPALNFGDVTTAG